MAAMHDACVTIECVTESELNLSCEKRLSVNDRSIIKSFMQVSLFQLQGLIKVSQTSAMNLSDLLLKGGKIENHQCRMKRMTWVKIFGTSYSTGCVIITGLYHGQPIFGEIIKVLLVMGNIIFQYKTLQVLEYSEHLNAYQVTPCYDVHFIKQDQLQDFHPLGIHQGFGNNSNKLFVVMRYVVDSLQ